MTKRQGEDKNKIEEEKSSAIKEVVKEIQERFGEGAIMTLGQAKKLDIDFIPTGSISLDIALGIGGIPRGRVTEIYGPESSGKTTLAIHILAEAQKRKGTVAFIDAEHALDPQYAKRIGLKVEDVLISQPDTGEQALEIVESLVRSQAVDAIVIDSVAALTPRAEIEGEMGQSHMGLQARLMSQALRKLAGVVSKTKTAIIFLNQIRMKIGIVFGNPETTPGGKALKFYSSVRIELRRAAQIKKGDEIIGNRVRAKVVKNKVAAPFRTAEFDIMYNKGISFIGDLISTAAKYNVIAKGGSWYAYEKQRLGQGLEASKEFLEKNPSLVREITKKVYQAVGNQAVGNQAVGNQAS